MSRTQQRPDRHQHGSMVWSLDYDGHGSGGPKIGAASAGFIRTINSTKAFTLLEITLVILIFGILLALSVPRLSYLTAHDLSVSSRRLSGTVRYLFHRATLKRTIYRLTFDLKANEYWVTYRNEDLEFVADSSPLTRKVKLPRDVSFEDIVIVGKGKFKEGEIKTHFFPKGWVEETLVHLRDTGGRQTSVHILPLSGRVEIYEDYVEPKG
jgi:general secretion pathway protein H